MGDTRTVERLERLEQELERVNRLVLEITERSIRERNALLAELAYARQHIACLNKKLFGTAKSEKFVPNQLEMSFIAENAQLADYTQDTQDKVKIEYERPRHGKERKSRDSKFDHLPIRKQIEIIPEEVRANPEQYEQIGEPEESFQIGYEPPRLFQDKIIRPKFRHKNALHWAPVVAPAPARIIDKSFASVSLIVQIILAKYIDHIPLYRQSQQFKRLGVDLPDNTMCGWLHTSVNVWLRAIYNEMFKRMILYHSYMQIDESPITYLKDAAGGASRGFLWVLRALNGETFYAWKDNRRYENIAALLKDFKGAFQSDAYEGYVVFGKANAAVTHSTCWAHVRRKFFEAQDESPRVAAFILKRIGVLFHLEKQYRLLGYSEQEIVHRRKQDHPVILDFLKRIMQHYQSKLLPKGKFSIAINYALKNWDTLTTYLDNGQVQLSTNLVENAIRPSAVGKKNWLFMGSNECGETAAILYTLLITCRNLNIDPREYLTEVFEYSISCPDNQLMDYNKLTPIGWLEQKQSEQKKLT